MPEPTSLSRASWRQAQCLGGCGTIVKQTRDTWVELGGTRSGGWLIAMGVEAGRALSDKLPPSTDEDLLILGVAHMGRLEKAFRLLRSQRSPLKTNLPIMTLEVMEKGSGSAVE